MLRIQPTPYLDKDPITGKQVAKNNEASIFIAHADIW